MAVAVWVLQGGQAEEAVSHQDTGANHLDSIENVSVSVEFITSASVGRLT